MQMSNAARWGVTLLVMAFVLNHLILGLFWLPTYTQPLTPLLAFGLYLAAATLTVFGTKELKMSTWKASFSLAVAVLLPFLTLQALPISSSEPSGSYQTWFVAGSSTLMAIATARGHAIIAWLGLAALWIQVIMWGGVPVITTSGLIGALLLVAASYAIGRGLTNTAVQTQIYLDQAIATSSRAAQLTASRTERQRLLKSIMLASLPLLERIETTKGNLSQVDRSEAELLAGRLSDEIRGRALMSDGIRVATREARRRGVTVNFLDNGGLDNATPEQIDAIQQSIEQAISATNAGEINVRAPKNEGYLVSVIATRPEADAPDIWLRLS
jgi:hypothetical protein